MFIVYKRQEAWLKGEHIYSINICAVRVLRKQVIEVCIIPEAYAYVWHIKSTLRCPYFRLTELFISLCLFSYMCSTKEQYWIRDGGNLLSIIDA